jgi:hypothetical protein
MPSGLTLELMTELSKLCHQLNEAGANPLWTPRLLGLYADGKFGTVGGLSSLSFMQGRALCEDLSRKLDARLAKRDAVKSMATPGARKALERAAAAAGGGEER